MRRWWTTAPWSVRLGVICALALAWRLIYTQLEIGYMPLTDEAWYIGQAHNLFGAHPWTSIFDFNVPTAQHGPLTSIALAPVAWLFPHATVSLRLVMAFVGTATVFVCALCAREIGGDRAALCTAVVAGALPDFWIRDGLVVSEPFAALIVATAVLVTLRSRQNIRYWHVASLGALCGLMALTRAEITPVMVLIVVVALWRQGYARIAGRVLGALVVAAVVVVPWSWYNSARFSDSVLISNNIGTTLVGANCPDTYYGSLMGYDSLDCEFQAQARATKVSNDESVQSSLMRQQAQSYVTHHLARVPEVLAMREVWFLGLYRPGWVVHMGTLGGQPAWATWLQALSFYGVFPLAMWTWWKSRRRGWPNWLIATLVANSFIVVAVFVGHWRYRVTLDVAMALILGVGWARSRDHKPFSTQAALTEEHRESSVQELG